MFRQLAFVWIAVFAIITVTGCGEDAPENPSGEGFDKKAMLLNIGQNVILVSYQELSEKVGELEQRFEAFETARNPTNLNALRSAMIGAHSFWQACSHFEFGPAADQNLRLSLNTFPTDSARINEKILAGDLVLNGVQDNDAKGFPAMEYLLFSKDESAILDAFENEAYRNYFSANLAFVSSKVILIKEAWETQYLTDFSSNTSSSAGSSISLLVNQLNYDFELTKNAKIGIPLGKKTLGIAQPDQTESPYAQQSIAYTLNNIRALKNTFSGGSGLGLDDYLDALGAKYNQADLSDEILLGFEQIETKLQAIDGDLVSAINDNPTQVEDAYSSMQNLVVLLKVDMPSQLGVQITYQDNDGD